MKHAGYALKMIAAASVTISLCAVTTKVLMPEYYNDEYWPETTTFEGFYQLKKDSVDVLFLGSSHPKSAYDPHILYDSYGIRSYSLTSEEQSLAVSYWWLEEALKYQHPQAVVLDILMAYEREGAGRLNSSEPMIRKAMDPMKWGSIKVQAVNDITSKDPEESRLSYCFPSIRYHERWKSLKKQDFNLFPHVSYDLKGYALLAEKTNYQGYAPLDGKDDGTVKNPTDPMLAYLDQIQELCEENHIQLILTNTIGYEASNAKYISMKRYAEQNGLVYVDFNLKEIYEEIQYQFNEDNADAGHANWQGAAKMTDYIGKVLVKSQVHGQKDAQWENSDGYYQQKLSEAVHSYE